MPIESGSVLRLPQPMSRVIVNYDSLGTLRAEFVGQTPIGVNFASPEQCSGPISGAVANRVSNRQGPVSAKLTLIGQTPWSARVPLDPLFEIRKASCRERV